MKVEDWLKIGVPAASVLFAAGGLVYQLRDMNTQVARLVAKVDANTSQVAKLTGQLELFWGSDWVQMERRLTAAERRIHAHQTSDRHPK